MHFMAVDQAMAERLIEARELAGFQKATDACTQFGWRYSSYKNYEGGHRGFTRHVPKFAAAYGVNPNWLLTGRGVPRLSGKKADHELLLTREERELIEFMRSQAKP